MSTKRNGPKRLTPTTVILVLVLLGAVAGASRLVSPPPPGPPEVKPTPASPRASDAKMKAMMEVEMRKNKEMMMKKMKPQTGKLAAVPDPSAMVIENSYFIKTKPGEEGLKQVDERQKRMKAEYQAYQKKVAASQGTTPVPQDKPIAVPGK
jgi:hypothetical protein